MELRPLFQYIKTESVNPDDSFVSMIHQRVLKYQNDEEVAYNMTLEEDFLREREKAERKGCEIGMAEGREAGLAEGREAGLAEGRVEMQERINKLGLQLKAAGRLDDLFHSMEDTAYQQQLLEEFKL